MRQTTTSTVIALACLGTFASSCDQSRDDVSLTAPANDGGVSDDGGGDHTPPAQDGGAADGDARGAFSRRDGSRLKIRFLVSEDGTQTPNGIFDTKLGSSCWPYTWPDGSHRCVPDFSSASLGTYADSACTQPVVPGGTGGSYVLETVYQSCHLARRQLWRRGEAVSLVTVYRRDPAGGCVGGNATASGSFRKIEPVLDTELVRGTTTSLTTGRIAFQGIEYEDGARTGPFGWRDTQLGFDCRVITTSDGVRRCGPSTPDVGPTSTAIYPGGPYIDDACTMKAVAPGQDDLCAGPEVQPYVLKTISGFCGQRIAVHPRGARAAQLYWQKNGVCVLEPAGSVVAYSYEPETPPSTFAPLDPKRVPGEGTGRLRPMLNGTDEGRYADGTFFDTKLGRGCSAATASDGVVRCLPYDGATNVNSNVFADEACAVPLVPIDACASIDLLTRVSQATSTTQVFMLGPAHTATTIYVGRPGDCAMQAPSPGTRYFPIGAEIPPAELARLAFTAP